MALHCMMLHCTAVHFLERIVPPVDRLWLSGKVTPDNGETTRAKTNFPRKEKEDREQEKREKFGPF